MITRARIYFLCLLALMVISTKHSLYKSRKSLRSFRQFTIEKTRQQSVDNTDLISGYSKPIRNLDCHTCRRSLKCESWLPSDEVLSSNQKSMFRTSETKFLLPWLYNGPNNQLFGLRQAAYVAIRLNRTLVLPLMHKHFTDDNGSMNTIDANHRFDVAALGNLLPVITLSEYRRHCSRQPDVIFLTSSLNNEWTISQLRQAEEKLNIDILNKGNNGNILKLRLENRLQMPFLPKHKAYRTGSSEEEILSNYQTNKQCALYALPFREVSFSSLGNETVRTLFDMPPQSVTKNTSAVPDLYLNALISKSTQLPLYVKEIAQLFVDRVLSDRRYTAMHWRYDKDDFYEFMCVAGGNPQNKHNRRNPALTKMCATVAGINIQGLSRSVYEYLSHNASAVPHDNIIKLYVAAPPKALNWLMKGLLMYKPQGIRFFSSKDLRQFLISEKMLDRCEFLNRNLEDFLSLVETQLCIDSQVFLRSSYSSWSDNIALSRKLYFKKYHRFDRRIQSLAFG